jgi:hypothetical protein
MRIREARNAVRADALRELAQHDRRALVDGSLARRRTVCAAPTGNEESRQQAEGTERHEDEKCSAIHLSQLTSST